MNIVLHEPGIALNTGNIGRTCAATNTSLHLIRPYGFHITEKEIKRAGMDYWDKIDLHEYIDYEDFLAKHKEIDLSLSVSNKPDAKQEAGFKEAHIIGCNEGDEPYRTDIEAQQKPKPKLWFATTKARQCYTDVSFGADDYIMLGNESRGIPEEILAEHPEACIRIPMWGEIRSLNLANSAAIILYEALRQNGFEHMAKQGNLHRLSWNESNKI